MSPFRVAVVPVLLASMLLVASVPSYAEKLQMPGVGYSADSTMETEYGSFSGKIHYSPKMERREMDMGMGSQVIISRYDKGLMWILMPEQKMYIEQSMNEAPVNNKGNFNDFDFKMTPVGNETVNGVSTTKYKTTMTSPDGIRQDGYMWMTRDDIMVKMDAVSTSGGQKMRTKYELKNLKIGNQKAELFEIPTGYNSMGKGYGNPGGSMPGTMPGMEDLMKKLKK